MMSRKTLAAVLSTIGMLFGLSLFAATGTAHAATLYKDLPNGAPPQGIVFDAGKDFTNVHPTLTQSGTSRYKIINNHSLWPGGYSKDFSVYYDGSDSDGVLPGSFSLRWPNMATDQSGDKIDIVMTVSDINSHGASSGAMPISMWRGTPYATGGDVHNGSAGTYTTMNISYHFYKTGTNNPANGNFATYFVDLDTYNHVPEGIHLKSNYGSDIHVVPNNYTAPGANHGAGWYCLHNADYTFIYANSDKLADNDTINSGFMVTAHNGFSFSWQGGGGVGTGLLMGYANRQITATADYGGSISSPGTVTVGWKNNKTYTITPQPGWAISDVLVDGVSVGAKTSYTFNTVTVNHTIHAKFKRLKGSIRLFKVSSEPNLSVGNRYSLAGAEYGVYYDEACTWPVKYNTSSNELSSSGTNLVLTTNASGVAQSPVCLWYNNSTNGASGIPNTIGDYYYVKETKASKGFRIDPTVYKVAIHGNPEPFQITSREVPQRGYIRVGKASTADWTSDNEQYRLDGVRYTFTPQGFTFSISEQVTDTAGRTGYVEVPLGIYIATENNTPNGYYPADGTKTLDIADDLEHETAAFDAIPLVDDYPLHIRKYDADDWSTDRKNGWAQAAYSLDGAIYSVSYYDGYFTDPNAPTGRLKWTKYFQTSAVGDFSELAPEPEDFYSNGRDKSGWPLGTYVVDESSAPEGYYTDRNAAYVFQISRTGDKTADDMIKKGSLLASGSSMTADNPLISTETLMRSDIAIYKEGADYTTNDYYPARTTRQQGVTFQIINENDYEVFALDKRQFVGKGGVVYEVTTDANGYATTNDIAQASGERNALTLGKYRIHENAAKPGYKAADDVVVTLSAPEQEYSKDIVNKQGTAITIAKKDTGSGNAVKGAASFQILDAERNPVRLGGKTEFTTDSATGMAIIREKLMGDTYFVKEVKAPYGYQLSNELKEFTIDGSTVNTFNSPLNIDFSNDPAVFTGRVKNIEAQSGSLITASSSKMRVVAAEDIVTLDGTIRHHKGDVIGETGEYSTTDATFEVPGLYPGRYTVTQVEPPEGYMLNGADYTLTINANGKNGSVAGEATVPNMTQTGGMHLTIVDSETKHVIPGGATYELRKAGTNELVQTLVTNENGYASVESYLPMGEYVIVEKTAPEGYILNPEPVPVSFVAKPGQDTITVNVIHPNDPQKGVARVAKRDSAGEQRLITTSPAEFSFYASEDIYTKDGSLRYYAGQFICTATTATQGDDAGYAKSIPMYCGKYYVKETKAPKGYSMNPDTSMTVDVAYSGDTAGGDAVATFSELIFLDDRKMGKIEIAKTDAVTNTPIHDSKATFDIIADGDITNSDGTVWKHDGEVAATIDTNANGVATSDELPLGKYQIREKIAPNKYALNATSFPVELVDGDEWASEQFVLSKLIIPDERQQGIIRVTKVSESFPDTKLAGAAFDVIASENIPSITGDVLHAKGEKIERIVTGADGVALSRELPAGRYQLVETIAPAGYELNEVPIDVAIGYDETQKQAITYVDVTVKDKLMTSSTKITKVDGDNGTPIPDPGTELKIISKEPVRDPQGNVIHEAGTEIKTVHVREDGSVIVNELLPGKYELVEVTPPNGYVKNPEPIPFDVVAGENGEVEHPGYPQRADIMLTKVDAADGSAITSSSASFEVVAAHDITVGNTVRHKAGSVVTTMTTRADTGVAIAGDLLLGRYTIRETAAPDGYRLSNETVDVILMYDEDNVGSVKAPSAKVEFEDHKITASEPEIIPPEPIPSVPDVLHPLEPEKPVANKLVGEWKIDNGEYVPARYAEVADTEKMKDDEVPKGIVSNTGEVLATSAICASIAASAAIALATRRRHKRD